MNLASHVETLRRKHQRLESEIFESEQHPGTDHLNIVALKREKLKLKDEIEKLDRSIH